MKKVLSLILLTLTLLGSLLSCGNTPWKGNRPGDQPGTAWRSEDGTIVFTASGNYGADGTIMVNSESGALTVDVHFSFGPATYIYVFRKPEDGENTPFSIETDPNGNPIASDYLRLESWRGDFTEKDRFTATVEKSTYFTEGQKINFFRIDDSY